MEIPNTGATLYQMANEGQERATFSLYRVTHLLPGLVFSDENLADGVRRLYNDESKYEALLNIQHWIAYGFSALVSYNPEDGEPVFDLYKDSHERD